MQEINAVIFFNSLWRGSFVDTITLVISSYYFIGFLVAATFIVLVYKKKYSVLLALCLSLLLYLLVVELALKHLMYRPRPFMVFPQVVEIGRAFSDSSFPSGHVAFSVAYALPLVLHFRKLWPAGIFFVLLMAFARLHNGVHYPSDILVGFLLGALCSLAGIYAVKWVARQKIGKRSKKSRHRKV